MHTSPRREACLRVLTTPRPQHILSHEGLGGCLSILGGVVVNRFRGLVLCGAVVVALAVSALVGVGSSSATVFTDPSGNPFPRYAGFPDDPYLFWMTPMEAAEIHRLQERITTASFVTSTTETMPVNDPSVKGYVPSSSPPTGNPYKPDRYEPDNKVGQAKLLPIERSQVRTLKRGDVDYVKVTANQGGGFIVVATSGVITLNDPWAETTEGGPTVFDEGAPSSDWRIKGKTWILKITTTSRKPISYRLSHVRYLPAYLAGEDVPGVADMVFQDAVSEANVDYYYECTGVRTSVAELARLRTDLYHLSHDDSWNEYFQTPDENAPIQRDILSPDSGNGPLCVYTKSEMRGGRWYVVGAGVDGSVPQSDVARYCQLVDTSMQGMVADEPVIYLYPTKREEVRVHLAVKGEVTTTSPVVDASQTWDVTADPSGTLTDATGKTWPYLFWEARLRARFDMSEGSVVAASDTQTFLDTALAAQGLDPSERAAFEAYWLPRMKGSAFNLIHFEGAAYEQLAPLDVWPRPDTSIRVFMVWKPLDRPVATAPQTFSARRRRGFMLVEWGGTELQ